MKTRIASFSIAVLTALLFLHCKKDVGVPAQAEPELLTDAILYNNIKSETGYTNYKSDPNIKPSTKETAHGPWFRVRFNSIAAAALTDNGKLPAGGSFPEGSIVVKELYETASGGLKYLAVMQKNAAHPNSNEGWLWSEFESDGKIYYSISNKGTGCVSCHSNKDRDKVRLFELIP